MVGWGLPAMTHVSMVFRIPLIVVCAFVTQAGQAQDATQNALVTARSWQDAVYVTTPVASRAKLVKFLAALACSLSTVLGVVTVTRTLLLVNATLGGKELAVKYQTAQGIQTAMAAHHAVMPK